MAGRPGRNPRPVRARARSRGDDSLLKDRDEAIRKLQVLRRQKLVTKDEVRTLEKVLEVTLGSLLAFHQLLTNADIVEPKKRKRKSSDRITLNSLARTYLNKSASSVSPLSETVPPIEFELLLDKMVNAGLATPIPNYRHFIELPDYELHKRRLRAVRHQRLGAKGVTYTQHFGVVVTPPESDELPVFLLLTGSDGERIHAILYHGLPTDKVGKLYDWFQAKRAEFSPFRGQVTTLEGRSIHFLKSPRSTAWGDIVPEPDVRQELDNCLHMMLNAADYRKRDLPVRRGVILTGPPGTGKTVHLQSFVTDVLAANLPVFQILSSVSSDTLQYTYELAEQVGPACVILEDIDTIAAQREQFGPTGSLDMLSALLHVLDGAEKRDGVITIATTNEPESIDRALAARPGRFDRLFRFEYLSPEARRRILTLHAKRREITFDPCAYLDSRASNDGDDDVRWVLEEDGVTPAHLAEAVDSIARDLTRDKSLDPEESFAQALSQMKRLVRADERFVQKGPTGFRANP